MTQTSETAAEAEIQVESARDGLVHTLSQLRENLKPANVVNEVMANTKVNVTAITDQLWDTAKKNPLPALMIGAGLAMIFGVGARGSLTSQSRVAAAHPPSPTATHGLEPEFKAHIARDPLHVRSAPTMGERATAAMGTVSDAAGDVLNAANQRLSQVASQGAAAMGHVRASATRSHLMSNQPVGAKLRQMIEEQPLVLAALGVALGAAIGAALPHSQMEDNLLGETSGSLRNAAQDALQEQFSQVKSAAVHAVEDIKQTVADRGLNAENLSGLVQDVGEKAKSATYEAGRAVNPES